MKIIGVKCICPGKRHAWYDTDLGFAVRKPIGEKIYKTPFISIPKFPKLANNQQTWWMRLKLFIKQLCKF
jgi:hypothetical protein